MKKLLISLLTLTLSATSAFAQLGAQGLIVREEDGNPNVYGVYRIDVSNGTLTKDANGHVSISTGGGGSGATELSGLNDVGTSVATAGNLLIGDGTQYNGVAVTGDVTITSAGVTWIGKFTSDVDAQSNNITAVNYIDLNALASQTYNRGQLYYSDTNEALEFFNDESEVELQLGQENWIRVYNNSGSTITNGSVVYTSGKEDVEDRLTIALAQADANNTSKVLGFATHDIENNTFGWVTQFGYVNSVNTASFADGESIWLSATVAGAFTNVEPQTPNNSVFLGYVVDSAASGNLFITTLGNTSGDTLASDATQLITPARKASVGTITKGQLVYIAGYNTGAAAVTVELADADGSNTYPALGVANDTITNAANGNVVISGRVANIDTSSYSVNDSLYLSTTAGAFTGTKPTGTNDCIQKVANVLRSNASVGVIEVVGAGRCNDIPNNVSLSDLSDVGTTVDTAGNILIADGSGFDAIAVSGDITIGSDGVVTIQTNSVSGEDISITSEAAGDILQFDGTRWVPTPRDETKCIWIETPTDADDLDSLWHNGTSRSVSVSAVWSESDGTFTHMLQIDGVDMDSVDLNPNGSTAEDTSLNGTTTVAQGSNVDIEVTTVTNATWAVSCFTYNDAEAQ